MVDAQGRLQLAARTPAARGGAHQHRVSGNRCRSCSGTFSHGDARVPAAAVVTAASIAERLLAELPLQHRCRGCSSALLWTLMPRPISSRICARYCAAPSLSASTNMRRCANVWDGPRHQRQQRRIASHKDTGPNFCLRSFCFPHGRNNAPEH